MLLSGYNITIAQGNTLRLRIGLKRDGGFTSNDKMVLKIRNENEKQLISKVLDISNNAAFFTLDSAESLSISTGMHKWDITIYINAQIKDGKIISAEEVITPFMNAKFEVKKQASREEEQ